MTKHGTESLLNRIKDLKKELRDAKVEILKLKQDNEKHRIAKKNLEERLAKARTL